MVYKPPLRASLYHFLILFGKVMTLKHLLIFQLIVVYAQAAVFLHPGYSWVRLKKGLFFKKYAFSKWNLYFCKFLGGLLPRTSAIRRTCCWNWWGPGCPRRWTPWAGQRKRGWTNEQRQSTETTKLLHEVQFMVVQNLPKQHQCSTTIKIIPRVLQNFLNQS